MDCQTLYPCDTHCHITHSDGQDTPHELIDRAASPSKADRYQELCQHLTCRGMSLDWQQDMLPYTTPAGEAALCKTPEVQRKHVFETMAAKGDAKNWSAAKLFVRDDIGLNVHRKKIDPVAAIALIHTCGGIAVLVHPNLIDETICIVGRPKRSRAAYIEEWIEAGLDEIEVRYTYDKTTYKGNLSPEEMEEESRARYSGRLKTLSGGSDYHAGERG